ncbi:hypothetical protein FQN57_007119 [Myotisia sp. PD_48]|nr:hypothetical protein FQN57_007119 [Myotisia sp. PD_48]
MGNAQSLENQHRRRRHSTNRLSKPLTFNNANTLQWINHQRWQSEPVQQQPWVNRWHPQDICLEDPELESSPITINDESSELQPQTLELEDNQLQNDGATDTQDNTEFLQNPVAIREGEFKRRFSRSHTIISRHRSLDTKPISRRNTFTTNTAHFESLAFEDSTGLGIRIPSSVAEKSPFHQLRISSVRRRSFNTPGVATRFPRYNNHNINHTTFQSTLQDDGFFDFTQTSHTKPQRSSTDAGIHRCKPRSSSPSRATSPQELEYSHLGRLKFGSLRIVNASISPTPSTRKRMSCPDLTSAAASSQDRGLRTGFCETTFRSSSPEPTKRILPPTKAKTSRLDQLRRNISINTNLLAVGVEKRRPVEQMSTNSPSEGPVPIGALHVTSSNNIPTRRPSISWYDDSPNSPLSPDSPASDPLDSSRPNTPLSFERTPVLSTIPKMSEHEDKLLEDDAMEIPVYWDDTTMAEDTFRDRAFYKPFNQVPTERKPRYYQKHGYHSDMDSGYSSSSQNSKSKHRNNPPRSDSAHRNGRVFDVETTKSQTDYAPRSDRIVVVASPEIISTADEAILWPAPLFSGSPKAKSAQLQAQSGTPEKKVPGEYQVNQSFKFPAEQSSSRRPPKTLHPSPDTASRHGALEGKSSQKSKEPTPRSDVYRNVKSPRFSWEIPQHYSPHHNPRSFSDVTYSRNLQTNKPLPALPRPQNFSLPGKTVSAYMLPYSSSSLDLGHSHPTVASNSRPKIYYDDRIWGSLSADPVLDLGLRPLHLDSKQSTHGDSPPSSSLKKIPSSDPGSNLDIKARKKALTSFNLITHNKNNSNNSNHSSDHDNHIKDTIAAIATANKKGRSGSFALLSSALLPDSPPTHRSLHKKLSSTSLIWKPTPSLQKCHVSAPRPIRPPRTPEIPPRRSSTMVEVPTVTHFRHGPGQLARSRSVIGREDERVGYFNHIESYI